MLPLLWWSRSLPASSQLIYSSDLVGVSLLLAGPFVEYISCFKFRKTLGGKACVLTAQVLNVGVQSGQLCSSLPIVEPPAGRFAWSGLPPDQPSSGLASSTPLVIGLTWHFQSVCRGQNHLPEGYLVSLRPILRLQRALAWSGSGIGPFSLLY